MDPEMELERLMIGRAAVEVEAAEALRESTGAVGVGDDDWEEDEGMAKQRLLSETQEREGQGGGGWGLEREQPARMGEG